MKTFIDALPKVELHCHIEGTFEPELMFQLARRNGVELPYDSIDSLREAYAFTKLQDFLDIYYQGMNVLLTEQDFFDLTWAYLEKSHTQQVRHVEIFFDPQGHLPRGVPFSSVVNGIHNALTQAKERFGITSELIMCFLRHLDEEDAIETLNAAAPYKDLVTGIGLDSSELGHPPSKFERVFQQARDQGYRCVAHAGEEGPAQYVREAIRLLKVDRIDHGNNALDDSKLVDELREKQIPLTVCPLSNTRLCVVDHMQNHPIRKMLDLGLCATVNSDDPAYFGGYMTENYNAITQSLGLNKEEIITLAKNGIESSFAPKQRKQALLEELSEYASRN
ncbi:MAG: adenosine deaminase [Gammaproteobacteria bacterium]|nr:adenosine deaminase [Gammaproteobacteria bacterium]NKB62758.1 adenosine deaminase [Gammaproteobacteria bacterium]